MAKAQAQKIELDLSALENVIKQITTIDTQISAVNGSEAQVRKSVAAELANENNDRVEEMVTAFIEALDAETLPVVIGVLDRFEDQVSDQFKNAIDEALDEKVKAATSGSKDDLVKLREDRKQLLETSRAMRSVFDTFGFDHSSIPEPKRSTRGSGTGSSGPKSAKNKEGYQYTMDGADRPPSQNSASSLAYYSTVGVPKALDESSTVERWSTKEMKQFLLDQGVKFGEDDEWEVTLPNGKKIGARRFTQEEMDAFEAAANKAKTAEEEGTDEDDTVEEPVPANA